MILLIITFFFILFYIIIMLFSKMTVLCLVLSERRHLQKNMQNYPILTVKHQLFVVRIKDLQSRRRSKTEALCLAIGKKNEMISDDPECLVGPYFARVLIS